MQRSVTPDSQSTQDRPEPSGRFRMLVPVLVPAVALLVFLVALGSSRSLAHVGGPGDLAQARRVTGALFIALVGLAVVPATVFVVWKLIRELRGEEWATREAPSSEKRLFMQLLGLASVVVAIVALALATRENRDGAVTRPRSPSRTVESTSTPYEQTAATLLPWVFAGVSIALLLLIVTSFVLHRRRRANDLGRVESLETEVELKRRELRELVDDSLAQIERELDPRRAVIRAYVGMERTLARHGLGRHRSEAPFEYLARALGAAELSNRAGERLTRLFERARFSEHVIDPGMKSEAIAALSEVRGELEADPG